MTSFETVINRFLHRVEKDADFFQYYNLDDAQVQEIIHEQSVNYLYDAIGLLVGKCSPSVDFYNYDMEIESFLFDLTPYEINMLASLMFQVRLERDQSLLGAFRLRMSPSDLTTFSPANERTSFQNMLSQIQHENDIMISHYASVNRETGKALEIDHSQFNYDS